MWCPLRGAFLRGGCGELLFGACPRLMLDPTASVFLNVKMHRACHGFTRTCAAARLERQVRPVGRRCYIAARRA